MVDNKRTTLKATLTAIQGEQSDYRFAKKLKIPRTTWRAFRTGERTKSSAVLEAIARTFPQLDDLLGPHLRNGNE